MQPRQPSGLKSEIAAKVNTAKASALVVNSPQSVLNKGGHPDALLTQKERALFRLALAMGANREQNVRAFTCNALESGWTVEEIRYAIQMATQSFGAPQISTVALWVEEILGKQVKPS